MPEKTTRTRAENNFRFNAIALGALACLSMAVFASAAHAASTSVTSVVFDGTNVATTSAAIGTTVYDSATVASTTASTTPTGTVDFNLYPNTTCSSTATTQLGVLLVNGTATSSTTTVPAAGLSYLVHYNGDETNAAADGVCEPVTPIVIGTTTASGPNAPEVITDSATNVAASDATLNGTNGNNAATQESFWVSTSTIDTSSSNIPASVYSTPVLPAASANAALSDQLSLVTTQGITTGGVNANMSAITPNTTYYYVAWSLVGGTWYPGQVLTVTTTASTSTSTASVITDAASGETTSDATLNGTNGPVDASSSSFWVSTSPFVATSTNTNLPAGVYSTLDLGPVTAGTDYSALLSSLTNAASPSDMPAVTASTTYYYAAWVEVDGTWYPGAVQSFVTTPPTATSTATISGEVYNDANRDGVLDNSETGLAGWTINLYNNAGWSGPTNIQPFMTTVSDANGDYSFANLPDGTYSIEEINQPASGWNQFSGDISPVVITNGVSVTNENFADVQGNPYSQGQGGNGLGNNGNGNGNNGNNNGNGNKGNSGNQQHGNGSFPAGNGGSHDQGGHGQTGGKHR
jgi:hypothetical protein